MGKRLRKPETGMVSNMTFSTEHELPSGKTELLFKIFQKVVFNLLSDRIFRKRFGIYVN